MSIINYNGESKVIKRICELLDTMTGISFVVVQTLPTTDIQTNVIYLVPKTTTEVDNIYDEYINTDGTSQGWELIGTTEIDLSDYYTKTESDNRYAQSSSLATVATSGDYDDLIDKPTIPTVNDGTLTIQLNGENQQTFTANSSSNKTANIKAVDWVSNGILGAKNLNAYPPYNETSHTDTGVVFTDNGDGTIKATGKSTSSSRSGFVCHSRTLNSVGSFILPNGTYTLTGCPSGGSESGYYIEVGRTVNGSLARYGRETGSGLTFTVNGDDNFNDKAQIQLVCYCVSNYQLPQEGIVFKPMIRLAEDTDNTWQPYAHTNKELTDNKTDWKSNGILGAKNRFTYPYYHPLYSESYTVRNVTYTENNGAISVSGTCDNTGNSYCQLARHIGQTYHSESKPIELQAGRYILTGGVSDKVWLRLTYYVKTDTASTPTVTEIGTDKGNGLVFEVTEQMANDNYFACSVQVAKNYATQGETLKPMIRLASDTDNTYKLYTMTNQELTNVVNDIVNNVPSTQGTYTLKATRNADNSISYSWV